MGTNATNKRPIIRHCYFEVKKVTLNGVDLCTRRVTMHDTRKGAALDRR